MPSEDGYESLLTKTTVDKLVRVIINPKQPTDYTPLYEGRSSDHQLTGLEKGRQMTSCARMSMKDPTLVVTNDAEAMNAVAEAFRVKLYRWKQGLLVTEGESAEDGALRLLEMLGHSSSGESDPRWRTQSAEAMKYGRMQELARKGPAVQAGSSASNEQVWDDCL